MGVTSEDIETTLRNAIPVSHLEIVDQSSGCGENYAIFVVSEVCLSRIYSLYDFRFLLSLDLVCW